MLAITSPAFANNGRIPARFTCDGEDVSPPLMFESVPQGTKTLALIMDDPDAPGGMWVHWVVWSIDPAAREVQEGSVPAGGVQGMTDFRRRDYGGPCPPSGTHRYFFKLYALDTTMDLKPNANKPQLEKAMQGHIIEKAELVGTYSRK